MRSLIRGVRTLAHGLGVDIVRYRDPVTQFPQDVDPDAVRIWQSVRPYTMTSRERVFALLDAVAYLVHSGISGDLVECGVWRGGSMMAAAGQLLRLKAADRTLHLFDTFEGMPPPTEHDVDSQGTAATRLFGANGRDPAQGELPWLAASVEQVREAMTLTGYPPERVRLIKGRTEDTLPAAAPESIALLRLDTDWYESTRHELRHLYPRIVRGGVLLIDDYGYWQGSRKAVDEYLREHDVRILLCRVDDCGRIAVVQ
jgi:O-methyltransferase